MWNWAQSLRRRLGWMGLDNDKFDIDDEWYQSSAEAQREFVYQETTEQLKAVLDFGKRQENKAFSLITLSLAATGALGIFGEFHLGNDALGLASICAVALSVLSAIIAIIIVRPVNWNLGIDPRLMMERKPRSLDVLRISALFTTTAALHHNHRILTQKGRFLLPPTVVLSLQLGSILSVALISSTSSSAESLGCSSEEVEEYKEVPIGRSRILGEKKLGDGYGDTARSLKSTPNISCGALGGR